MVKSSISSLKYFSLELLTQERLLALASPRVTTGQIFENGNIFHKDGLFSTEIFGDVGTKERNRMNGHIDLKIKILHPLVYIGITTMSSLHKGIIDGTKSARWDNELKDFVLDPEGETGYKFFMSKLKEIKFLNPNNSDLREFKIRLVDIHNIDVLEMSKTPVLAAGLRDYTVDRNGKPSQGEINDFYRSLINTAGMLPDGYVDNEYSVFVDTIRSKLQQTVVDIYLHSLNIIAGGKTSLIRSHLLSKAILDGTRNVITADNSFIDEIGKGPHLRFNEMAVGAFQHAKAIEKFTLSSLKRLFANTFSPANSIATVIDSKTFETERITVDNKTMDLYTTTKGLASYLNKFADAKFSKLTFGSEKSPFLMVLDNNDSIELVQDTSIIDPSYYKYLRPVTNIEILFMAIVPYLDKFYGSSTRYPAIQQGSQYIIKPKVKPTVSMRTVRLDINGMVYDVDNYPTLKDAIFDGMSPHQTKLAKADADYDGDMQNYVVFYTKESNEEIRKILSNRAYYIGADNKLVFSVGTDILVYAEKSIHRASKQ